MTISISTEQFQTIINTLEIAKSEAYTKYLEERKNNADRAGMVTATLQWAEYQEVIHALRGTNK